MTTIETSGTRSRQQKLRFPEDFVIRRFQTDLDCLVHARILENKEALMRHARRKISSTYARMLADRKIPDPDPLPPDPFIPDTRKKREKKHEDSELGLCVNCENRVNCNFSKPEGGVWYCEQFC